MTSRVRAYLELIRPANVITAFADVLAGFAAAGAFGRLIANFYDSGAIESLPENLLSNLCLLLASTAGLYAGGVVLNDVFDADLDAAERPERPIPSGRVTRRNASVLGAILLIGGIIAAALVGAASLGLAVLIAAGAVLYDAAGKHHTILGPVNMGLCRGGNLLLGISAVPIMLGELWYLLLLPVTYIGAVTAVSAGEVRGGSKLTGVLSLILVSAVTVALLLLGIRLDYRLLRALPFVGLFVLLVFPPFVRASLHPSGDLVRKAVKAGVISLVSLDAALAAGFGGWTAGLAVAALLPLSMIVGRAFAVT